MSAQILDIADAVVDELNDAIGLSQEFTATRAYLPEFELPELSTLRVTVLPMRRKAIEETRDQDTKTFSIAIGVQKRVNPSNLDAVDDLVVLVEEIADYMRRRELSGYDTAQWIEEDVDPVYDQQLMADRRVFTSVLKLTYQMLD